VKTTTHDSFFPFDNSYARLPERFFKRLPPTPVHEPGLIRVNEGLALQLGLSAERLATPEGIVDIRAGDTRIYAEEAGRVDIKAPGFTLKAKRK
jgi:uncharacterized protein YdiU (UPF0061 family)